MQISSDLNKTKRKSENLQIIEEKEETFEALSQIELMICCWLISAAIEMFGQFN